MSLPFHLINRAAKSIEICIRCAREITRCICAGYCFRCDTGRPCRCDMENIEIDAEIDKMKAYWKEVGKQ